MLKFVVLTAVFSLVYSTGIKLHLTDEVKAMLKKTKWDHKNTVISIQGPMTLDIQSSYKLKEGRVFLKSHSKGKYKDCAEILKHRPLSKDGVYTISPDMKTKRSVYCDMTTDGGGWTVNLATYIEILLRADPFLPFLSLQYFTEINKQLT